MECICSEYDARGKSVCGHECLVHPLDGKCPGVRGKSCAQRTHHSVQCFGCFNEEERQELADLLRITPEKVRQHLEDLARQLQVERTWRRQDFLVMREMRKRLTKEQQDAVMTSIKEAQRKTDELAEIRKPKNLDQPFTI